VDIKDIIRKIENSKYVSLDTETLSLTDKTLVAFSFCCDGQSFFVPVAMNTMENFSKQEVRSILTTILNRDNVIYHNYLFDAQVLRKIGFIPTKLPHDTMIIAHLLNENRKVGLKSLVKEELNYTMKTFKEVCGTGKKQVSFADSALEKAISYGTDDALWTYRLFIKLYTKLEHYDDLLKCYKEIEQPLLIVVDDMHTTGVPIDVNKLKQIESICIEESKKYLDKIQYYMSGINLNSPVQLRNYFVNKKFMPILKRSGRTGEPSVDSEVLEKYADRCPEAGWILKYRYYTKLLTTFIPALTPKENLRSYPQFNPTGTTSGRFSSSSPNYQNLPRNSDIELRNCISVSEDKVLIDADFSQMELRLAAHFSKDANMLYAYLHNEDIHDKTAKAVGCDRRQAKVVNFSILYGTGTKTLAKNLESSYEDAGTYMKKYFETYPSIREFMQQTKVQAIKQGYIPIYGGRRRNISINFERKLDWEKEHELRSMANAVIQGSAATIIKKAMIELYQRLKDYDAKIILQVHDELLVECFKKDAEQIKIIIKECMLNPTKDFCVPFEVDVKEGHNWGETHA